MFVMLLTCTSWHFVWRTAAPNPRMFSVIYQTINGLMSSFISPCLSVSLLVPSTKWSPVTHICAGKLTIIGSDNGLSPGRRQAIIWTNAGILVIGPLGTNFSEILIGIPNIFIKKMYLKMSSAKRRPFVSASVYQLSGVQWHLLWLEILVKTGSVPDGTKPLYDPVLSMGSTSIHSRVMFTWICKI